MQDAARTHIDMSIKEYCPWHIVVKMSNIQNTEIMLKVVKENTNPPAKANT